MRGGNGSKAHPAVENIFNLRPARKKSQAGHAKPKRHKANNSSWEGAISVRRATATSVSLPIKGKLKVQRFVVPYRVYGEGECTLVFINGVQQSMAMWHSFVRRFSQSYRIVLFDYPNQGAGRVVTGTSHLSLEEQVDILDAVINATSGADQLSLCSASWGGVVALAYAVRHPHRLKSLILASLGTKANQKMTEMITKGLEMPVKDRFEVAETLIENFGQELPAAMKKRIITQFQRMDTGAFEAFLQHGSTVISVRELSEVVDIGKVQCKTILVHGENDTIIDIDDVRFLASQMPRSELRIIKNVGHFLHLEKEELLDVYEDILASVC
jgi:pimeloyl-ACP methyl ester carboxylesterase